jgi:hypothetical protein
MLVRSPKSRHSALSAIANQKKGDFGPPALVFLHHRRGGRKRPIAGEYYFETGNLAHTVQNKTNLPVRLLVVEIVPKDWTAPAMIAPKSQ